MSLYNTIFKHIKAFFGCKDNGIDTVILGTHHVARYLRPSDVEREVVMATGFQYKKNKEDGSLKENELSVNWLEYFNSKAPIQENINYVRKAFEEKGYDLRKNARFGVLNVNKMVDIVAQHTAEHTKSVELMAKHTPTDSDPSHSSIIGVPLDSDGELLVSAILADYVSNTNLFPAKTPL